MAVLSQGIDHRTGALEGVRPDGFAAFGTALVAAAATFANVFNTTFADGFTTSHLLLVLSGILAIYMTCSWRLLLTFEFVCYAAFVAYLFVATLWTDDKTLALNTLFPAVDSLLTLLLFGALFAFNNLRAAATGVVAGFAAGAIVYSLTTGFPFVRPSGFSYNAVGSMYLFGLFAVIVLGVVSGARKTALALGLLTLAHILATTSIKTNFGVVLGVASIVAINLRSTLKLLWRHFLLVGLAVGILAYAISRNGAAMERVTAGYERVVAALEVLRTLDDTRAYTGFNEREYWMQRGLEGWVANPVFGHGVEAFRADFGITSHSTPVDLLYNTGLIGFGLFYAMFFGISWRWYRARTAPPALRAALLGALICYLFVPLSGVFFYQPLLAAYVAMSVALLRRAAAAR